MFLHGFMLISPIMIILTLGNMLSVKGFMKKTDIAALSKLLFWIISPALLFRNAFHIQGGALKHVSFAVAIVAAALISIALSYVAERYLFHTSDIKKTALTIGASVRPNTLYVGLPMVESVFGSGGVVHLSLYAAIAIPLYNFLCPLSSEVALAKRDNLKIFLKTTTLRILKNPMVIAPLCGAILILCGVTSLPTEIDKALQMLSGAATGISLIALGATIDIKHARGAIISCWREIIMRLFIHPALLLICLSAASVDADLKNVSVLVTATPTAATLFILANGIGLDGNHAAELTVITMLLSAITIPMWIVFLGIL